ncbi:5-hydroxytryptamine receptor 3A-like [Pelobates cultripes]|uniref:5-hydroxytryptamine receptor 3A-like n=1 Tax=Pelobates cultripes TaxID=61616 RepID=A0AAD1WUS0_PELCU|nr:5-hydroxytryptamine receptor 3A-like [Pelobates cultripes]
MKIFLTILYLGFAVHCQEVCEYHNVTDALGILQQSARLIYSRPVKNWKDPTYVSIDVIFRAVLDMDEKLQSLTTLLDFEMTWQNEFLSWDPQNFCGIFRVSFPAELIWIPDINILETQAHGDLRVMGLRTQLYYNGLIQGRNTLNVATKCSLDLYKFPFDSQKCNLTFVLHSYTEISEVWDKDAQTRFTALWNTQDRHVPSLQARIKKSGMLMNILLCKVFSGSPLSTESEQSARLIYSRPVKNWKDPTYVSIDVIFRAVLDMDEKLQSLTTLLDFEMTWQNEFLSWDPQNFCGIFRVSFPAELIWIPDINILETEKSDPMEGLRTQLYYNGLIQGRNTLNVATKCSLDLYKFPFDSQKCNLTFVLHSYTVADVIINNASSASLVTSVSLKTFAKGEWSLQNVDIFTVNASRQGEEWSTVIYQISIKRAPILYVINLIIPACLLVFVDVASMFIPMEGGERLGFKITVVLGFSVLLLILNDFLPNTDQPPILGVFCMVCLLIMIISIMDSIFISYMLHLSAVRPDVPNWLKLWVLKRLAYVLRIDTSEETQQSRIAGAQNKGMVEEAARSQESSLQVRNQSTKEFKDIPENRLLKRILLELLSVRRHLISTKKEEDARSQWHLVAFVLDRFILVLYLLIVIIIIVVVVFVWTA